MTDKLYFASETINEIKIDIIASPKGIRKILINKKSEPNALSEITQISSDDSKVINTFKQLKEYFSRERKEFDLQLATVS